MSLFRRRSSLFGGGSLFGRDRAYDSDPALGRGYGWMLTPPSLPLFLISAVIAAAALLLRYGHVNVPVLTSANVFDALAIAYVVLFAGVLLPRL